MKISSLTSHISARAAVRPIHAGASSAAHPILAGACAALRPTLALLALAAALPSQAQTPDVPKTLPETVITATRTPQPLSDLLADVSVVDRETIERSGATGVADVLARLPGVEMARNGGPGTSTSVYLRGAESRFTAVYIDGVRIDSQSTGGAAWESIPLALIDRIEVLRGPAAAVYGSDAIGGVIQIFTRRGERGFAPFVAVGVGTYKTIKAEAGFSGGTASGFDYALGMAHEDSKGFNARPIAGQNPDRDGYRSNAVNARLGLQINPSQRIEGTVLANHLNSGYDSSLTQDDRNLHELEAMGLNWSSNWTDSYTTRLAVTNSRERYQTVPSPYLTETKLRGYLFQNEFRAGPHLLTAALERREDALQNAPIDRSRSQNALALGYGLQQGMHTVQLNLRHDNDSEFGGKNTGSAAYGYAFAPGWRATASAGTAFRAPTLYQRFSEYGVATLQPETSRNLEVGLRWAKDASSVDLVGYRNKVSNLISFVGAGTCASAFGCYANTARAEYSGITLSGNQRLGDVGLRASVDLQDPKDSITGLQLARRSRKHGTLGADTRLANWLVGAEAQFSGRRFDNSANTRVLGGYTVINLTASTKFAADWTVLARLNNLADKDYQLARTYATPGRNVYLGVKWAPQ